MTKKVTVLLPDEEFDRFDAYCEQQGYKKSTLLARLLRDLLNTERESQEVVRPRRLTGTTDEQLNGGRRARNG